jgi:hypothetical protein
MVILAGGNRLFHADASPCGRADPVNRHCFIHPLARRLRRNRRLHRITRIDVSCNRSKSSNGKLFSVNADRRFPAKTGLNLRGRGLKIIIIYK